MGLEFIYGASGHGKTYNLYERIIKEAVESEDSTRKFILIVPEQSSLQAQKDIVRMHPNKGVFNIDVLTFGRLGYRIFEELSTNLCETIDDTGKNLIIRKVMNEVKDELKIIKVNRKIGVVTQVKSMISEFKQYGITVDDLAGIIDRIRVSDRMKQKLNDVLIIYRGFEEYIKGHYITAEDKPEELLKVIDNSAFFDNAVVAFDGFTGFTPVQYRLFEKILMKAHHVINTVTLPKEESYNVISGEEELFYMSKNMMRIMGSIADRNGVSVKYSPIDTNEEKYRFSKSDELDFLEKELFRYSGNTFDGDVADIHIRNMTTPQAEVRIVAADILRQIRTKGLRYRDIAIVTGDISTYDEYIRRIFKECDIPFFMDCKQSLIGNPVVEYIRSAIEVVCNNFSYESVFRFLKNPLCKISQEDADVLENYVLSFDIKGFNRWNEKFIRPYVGKKDCLSEVNKAREGFIKIIGAFRETFAVTGDVRQKINAVYNLMEEADAFEYLKGMANELVEWENSAKNMARAAQYGQTYDKIIGLLEQLENLLGDEEMNGEEFSKILDAGFEEIKVGIIPPSIDCITVGDVERTRLEHVKVLFVLGVNEGILPKLTDNQGVLSENERRVMHENEIELAPTPRQKVFIQNFYLYLNLTEPEVALYLSYYRYNSSGKEAKESRIISLIRNMFPKLKVMTEEEFGPVDYLANAGNSMQLAVEGLFSAKAEKGIKEITAFLLDNEPYKSKLQYFIDVLTKENVENTISETVAKTLYQEIERSSITRMETYAKCAFSHFLSFGLELQERKFYELNSLDMGNIFHKVLELSYRKLKNANNDFSVITDEERYKLIEDCFNDAMIDYNASFFVETSTNAYLKQRIIDILNGMTKVLGKQLVNSKLKPAAFEKTFYKEFETSKITGKIDRVDLYEEDDKIYVKVVDYKSAKKDYHLDLDDVYNGVNIQLLVYLDNVLEQLRKDNPDKEVIAAGALYNKVDLPIIEVEKNLETELMDKLRPTGMVSLEGIEYMDDWENGKSLCIPVTKKKEGVSLSDTILTDAQLKFLSKFATNKMVAMQKEINTGEISVNPCEGACNYCKFASICGFNPNITEYRELESIKDDEEKWLKMGYKEEGGN